MSEFKVGDTVEITEGDSHFFKKGDKAILIECAEDGDWECDFTINDSYYKEGFWMASETAMKPFKTEKPKFKKGDIVEMLEGDKEFFKKGDKAILLSYEDDCWMCDFTINDSYFRDGHWFAKEFAMKLIKKEKGRKLKPQYKIGDKVIATADYGVINKGDFGTLRSKQPDNIWVVNFESKAPPLWKEFICIMPEEYLRKMKPIKPEKGIRIEVEKLCSEGVQYCKILDIKALQYDELPKEYTKQLDSIWMETLSPNNEKGLLMTTADRYWCLFRVGKNYKKEIFNERIEDIKKAGKMLREINQKRKWSGKETIII